MGVTDIITATMHGIIYGNKRRNTERVTRSEREAKEYFEDKICKDQAGVLSELAFNSAAFGTAAIKGAVQLGKRTGYELDTRVREELQDIKFFLDDFDIAEEHGANYGHLVNTDQHDSAMQSWRYFATHLEPEGKVAESVAFIKGAVKATIHRTIAEASEQAPKDLARDIKLCALHGARYQRKGCYGEPAAMRSDHCYEQHLANGIRLPKQIAFITGMLSVPQFRQELCELGTDLLAEELNELKDKYVATITHEDLGLKNV